MLSQRLLNFLSLGIKMKARSNLLWLLPVTAAAGACYWKCKPRLPTASSSVKGLLSESTSNPAHLKKRLGWRKTEGHNATMTSSLNFLAALLREPMQAPREISHLPYRPHQNWLSLWVRFRLGEAAHGYWEGCGWKTLSNNYLHKPNKFHLKTGQGSVPSLPIGRLF